MSIRPWKRGTAAQRAVNLTVPAGGEIGVETDTGRLIGSDGVHPWSDLSPAATLTDLSALSAGLSGIYVPNPTLLQSAALYVHPAGSDSNTGLTWAAAKQTIPAAITALGSAGGTVELGAGTFNVSSVGRIDSCTYATNSSTVLDASVSNGDIGSYLISGQKIQDLAVIASVVPGVSFTIVDGAGVPLLATGSGATNSVITKPAVVVPPGVRLRGRGGEWSADEAAQDPALDHANTWIIDGGTGVTILCGHGEDGSGDSGQLTTGIRFEDFAVKGNTANQFGIAAINDWFVSGRGVDSVDHGLGGLIVGFNANANRFQDGHFTGNGTAGSSFVTGGCIVLNNGTPYGPLKFDNCLYSSNYGWGVVGTVDFVTPIGALAVRLSQCQFNLAHQSSASGSGIHAAISGSEYRSMLDNCIFESADFLDLDIYDTPAVIAIACKFRGTGGSNGTLPYTVRVNTGATFEADSCGFLDATSYHVQVASGAIMNWRSCSISGGSSVLAASPAGAALTPSSSAGLTAGSTSIPVEPLNGMAGASQSNETCSRLLVNSAALALANQTLYLTYFTATRNQSAASQINVDCGSTASGGAATFIGAALFIVNSDGSLTQIAKTNGANANALQSANTGNNLSLAANVAITQGQRYAIGWLINSGQTLPTLMGVATPSRRLFTSAPILAAVVASQTTLPTSIASASLSGTGALFIWSKLS